jgi:hypothetical protein
MLVGYEKEQGGFPLNGLDPAFPTPCLDEFEDEEVAVVIATIREHIGKKG